MDWPPVSRYPEAFSSSSRCCAKRESAIFWRLDHWGSGRGFWRFCAVACADFQWRGLYKSFFELQAFSASIAKKGITCSHCRRHICVMTGNLRPHSLCSKCSKAARALSVLAAGSIGLSAAAQVLRSFQWAKASELRIKWTAGLPECLDRRLGSIRKAAQSIDDDNQNIVQPPIARH